MCHITKLLCEVCEDNPRHLFLPCGNFLSEQVKDETGAIKNHVEPGKRFYCSELKWPLDPDEDKSYWVCNTCLEFGRQSYKDSIEVVGRLNNPKPSQSRYVSFLRGKLPNNHFDNDESSTQGEEPGLEHLPVEFSKVAATTLDHLLSLYNNKDFPNHLWEDRVASSDGCYVTVWLPCCPVCKDPTVDPRKGGGIVDVEFELTSELWRWVAAHQKLAPGEGQAFEVNIATGFISKVCDVCCNSETVLRQQVHAYLQDSTRPRSWAVTTWLLSRGMIDKPFYNFSVMNVGLPDTMPPPNNEIMGLMTRSWGKLTNGLAFGDCVVDSSPPVAYSAPLTRHQKPLMSLDQWVRLVEPQSAKKLNVNHHQSYDVMTSDPSIASLVSNMPAGGLHNLGHNPGIGVEDDSGRIGEGDSDRSSEPGVNPVEEDNDDNISVSSDTSYTSYKSPARTPRFHFHPDEPKTYIMPQGGFVENTNATLSDGCELCTTRMLEKIAIGSVDAIIVLWHILGEFIRILPAAKTKRHYGHLKADWVEAHAFLGILVKFAATVREHPKKKYKHKTLLQSGQHTRKLDKLLDSLLTEVVRKAGYTSEPVSSDISELPIGVVAHVHRSITEGLLNLYMPDMSYSEGENGSLIVTVVGLAVCNSEWTTQRYRIPKKHRQVNVWEFTAPDFDESFAAAASEGKFVAVMRRSLFGEKAPGRMHGERHGSAHSRVPETLNKKSPSTTKRKRKGAPDASALPKGHRSSTQKHVRFASSPELEKVAGVTTPWWKIDEESAGPSRQEQPQDSSSDEDTSMVDADVIDLDDGIGAFSLCDKGGWHYEDVHGSAMGEMIELPGLGLTYDTDSD
ncbi:hypothetical protein PG993_014551 [Apiospora rasikravindrae]|uniref:Uncharacterized protein n=1 Tax=Apiospora rasikravindrae TaxID=990691 RepID=A0ABR1RND3_9PEZI